MNKDDIRLGIYLVLGLLCGNLLAEFFIYKLKKSHEYCNEDGYWVKTGMTGNPIGIAIDKNGKQITCEYKVERSN
jgi:hypothetical protein